MRKWQSGAWSEGERGAKAEPPPRTGAEGGARENLADAGLASVEPTVVDLNMAYYFGGP